MTNPVNERPQMAYREICIRLCIRCPLVATCQGSYDQPACAEFREWKERYEANDGKKRLHPNLKEKIMQRTEQLSTENRRTERGNKREPYNTDPSATITLAGKNLRQARDHLIGVSNQLGRDGCYALSRKLREISIEIDEIIRRHL